MQVFSDGHPAIDFTERYFFHSRSPEYFDIPTVWRIRRVTDAFLIDNPFTNNVDSISFFWLAWISKDVPRNSRPWSG